MDQPSSSRQQPSPKPQVSEQAPMAAHPPEAPQLSDVIKESYEAVEPDGFGDHPESSVEAADFEVDDTIGAE